MRKFLTAAVVGALLVPSLALADLNGGNFKRVAISVQPSIVVGAEASSTVAGTLQTGTKTLDVPFRIDANTQSVVIQAFVTDLFKADQGGANFSGHSIPHTGNVSVKVSPSPDAEFGGQLVGANGPATLAYEGAAQPIVAPDGLSWNFYPTVQGLYESGIRGRFSHDVTLDASWKNTNAELPMGTYSGWVRLYAAVAM